MVYYFFYFPIGTESRLRRPPVVTWGLALVLALVHYLFHHFRPTVGLYELWVLPTDHPTLLQAFTACFVHAGIVHLAGNLLYLLAFGPAIEDRVGRGPFLGLYLLAGIASMLVQVEVYRHLHPAGPPVDVLGASGAIAGVLGLFAARAWFLRVRVAHATFAYLQAQARGGVTPVPAWIALVFWAGLQAIYAAVAAGAGGAGVAYWAHFSGMALGFTVGVLSGQFHEGLHERRLRRGIRYLERGEWFAALGQFQSYREAAGERAEGLLGEARCHRILGRRAEALDAYRRAFDRLVEGGDWDDAFEAAEEFGRAEPALLAGRPGALRLAQVLEARGRVLDAAGLFQRVGEGEREPLKASRALERAAELARLRLDDLARAAGLYRAAATRLTDNVDAVSPEASERAARLRRRAGECDRVLAHRFRAASGAA